MINRFLFVDKCRFFCSYSKYTGEKLVRQNEIKSDGSLSISVDLARLENIQGQLNDYRRSCEDYDVQIQELQNSVSIYNMIIDIITVLSLGAGLYRM